MRNFDIPEQILNAQYQASQPDASSWVSANAGAGKTYVLAQRVIRLLMQGVAPQQILCLTYTKAAAAEMKRRIAKILGSWTQLDDAELKMKLKELDPDATQITEQKLHHARALFALSVETPGGLNVQTFHGFCERILHQFPLEANVPVQFSLGDELLLNQWKKQSLQRVLIKAQSDTDSALAKAYALLVGALGMYSLDSFILDAMQHFRGVSAQNVSAYLRRLAKFLDFETPPDMGQLDDDIKQFPFLPVQQWPQIADHLRKGGTKDGKLANNLLGLHQAITNGAASVTSDQIFDVFLTNDYTAPKRLISKAFQTTHPDVAQRFGEEIERLEALAQKYHAMTMYRDTKALVTMAVAANEGYRHQKQLSAILDFDDLIDKMQALVSRPEQVGWVHYKIDQGIDHILIDEAQDTSPSQWHIIQSLVADFFDATDQKSARKRTLFAVGDQKQSIYSFQGTRPELFTRMQAYFSNRSEAGQKPFTKVPMQHSFRSLPPIMEAVDKVFLPQLAHHQLGNELGPPVHRAVRKDEAGQVQIWPLVEPAPQPVSKDWVSALPAHPIPDPDQILAHQIAQQIADWLHEGRQIADRDNNDIKRAIQPSDIMILVQRRKGLFDALLTQLGDKGVPTAGADRLVLQDHIIVNDLIALAHVLLLPEDDLNLAVILKSPLFDLDETALFDLCHRRQGSVWSMLKQRAQEEQKYQRIYQMLQKWRHRVDIEKPFDLYSQILAADGVRARYEARFLSEAEDVCAEFLQLCLNYELDQVPSLAGFIQWVGLGKREIKREFDQEGVVRVMTAHGAKGLEAPIVFLADAARVPNTKKTGLIDLELSQNTDPEPSLYIWIRGHGACVPCVADALDTFNARQDAEYRRLLYVAMTRAENEIYVCGCLSKKQSRESPKSWYHLIKSALEEEAETFKHSAFDDKELLVWPKALSDISHCCTSNSKHEKSVSEKRPDWLIQPVSAPLKEPLSISVTQLIAIEDEAYTDLVPIRDAFSHLSFDDAAQAGTMMHMLLQYLPTIGTEKLEQAAMTLLSCLKWDMTLKRTLIEQAIQLIQRQDLSLFFGPDAHAEIPFQVRCVKQGERYNVHGVIDRLVILPDSVQIIDFKSSAYIPETAEQVPNAYKMQLILYKMAIAHLFPGRYIKTILLYTRVGTVIEIEESQFDAIDMGFTLA